MFEKGIPLNEIAKKIKKKFKLTTAEAKELLRWWPFNKDNYILPSPEEEPYHIWLWKFRINLENKNPGRKTS